MIRWKSTSSLLVAFFLASCSSGSTPVVSAPAGSSTTATGTTNAGAQPVAAGLASSVPLPAASGYSGTLTVAGTSQPAQLEANTGSGTIATQSLGSPAVLYAVTLRFPVTVTLASIPSVTIHLPISVPASEELDVRFTDSAGATIATDGPATISGSTATFPLVTMPITLLANTKYTLAVQLVTKPEALIYAGVSSAQQNAGSVAVFGRLASGNVPPLRTITGVGTPIALGTDPSSGMLWVLDQGSASTQLTGPVLEAFAAGAHGNATPSKIIDVGGTSHLAIVLGNVGFSPGIAVSPNGGEIVVSGNFAETYTNGTQTYSFVQAGIATYSTATGQLERMYFPLGPNFCAPSSDPTCDPIAFPSGTGIPTSKVRPRGIAYASATTLIAGWELFYRDYGSQMYEFPASMASSGVTDVTAPSVSDKTPSLCDPGPFAATAGFYVWNACEATLSVFSSANGGALQRTIMGSKTLVADPISSAVAIANNATIFTIDTTGAINVYAPTATGNVPPIRRIAGDQTGLNATPTAITLFGSEPLL
jgi:hypothetical protein